MTLRALHSSRSDDPKTGATREEVMNTAERLFADHGLDGVSVRDITAAAQVNIAAINYHFGSKAGLIGAILERRMLPLNQQRIAALDAAEKRAGDEPMTLEAVIDAFIRPVVERALDPKLGGTTFLKLIGRCFSEPGSDVEKVIYSQCEALFARFDGAWKRALPGLTMDEIYWRISFTHGALHHWLLTIDNPVLGRVVPGTWEEQLKRLIQFAAAGLRAPVQAATDR